MSFLYFIPGITNADDEALKSVGLDSVLDRTNVGIVHANGPDGGAGLIVCQVSDIVSPRMMLSRQTWRPAPKRGAAAAPYWIGYWNDVKPSEENLRRPKQLPGESIELRDGTMWMVPRLLQFDSSGLTPQVEYAVRLPQVLDLDDDGNMVAGKIDPKYQSLWDAGWHAHESLTQQAKETGTAVMTVLESRHLACRLLGWNYRVGPLEIATLGLLDDALPIRIVCSAIDNETFWTAIKNLAGRLVVQTTDSLSGAERPQTESITDTPTGQQLAS